ncbi:polar amino acid ABC transporter permease [Deltaproteobacteria bacterium Smac51]|nr:polar amino acid ABC transporter permease [Deltaproteobacteria bacterium Smac51]
MDSAFVIEYAPMFARAAVLTVSLAAAGIVLAVILGLACALIRYFKVPVLRRVAGFYIEVSRNTPLMIQLFFLYYGLTRIGILLEGVTCAIVGLAFLGGGYMAEAFRAGLEAVSRNQIETGLSIGLSRRQLIRYVMLPQAFAVAIPAISANTIFLMKETSVFSIIALPDLVYVAKDLLKEGHSGETNLMLVVSYLMIILPVSIIFSLLERRVRRAGFSG